MAHLCIDLITLALFLPFCAHRAQGANCVDGWTPHHDSCYLFLKETYNWFDAKTVCEELGGMLAEIEDETENHFLVGNSHGHNADYSWVGLQDFLEEGNFVWTKSRRHASPAFWNVNEPEDRNGEEDCGAIHADGWIDSNCEDSRFNAICEMSGESGGLIG